MKKDMVLDLALLRYRIARQTWENMRVWIRVLSLVMELKEEDDDGGGKVEKTWRGGRVFRLEGPTIFVVCVADCVTARVALLEIRIYKGI